jgi:outer membrane protein
LSTTCFPAFASQSKQPRNKREAIDLRKTGFGYLSVCLTVLLVFVIFIRGEAQNAPSQPVTLGTAVEAALSNYPSIRSSQAQAASAAAGIDLARTSYLPRADILWQQNIATRNNVFGLLLPQNVIPPISGPALDSTSMQGATGSAGGLLLSWEPFDFGLRRANVDLARSLRKQADAGVEVTRLDVATAAADAFMGLVAAEQVMHASQVTVERMEVFARAVQALVDNQLRPGVDFSRANAELAAARNQLIQAQQNAEISRAVLAETLGIAGAVVSIDSAPLLSLPALSPNEPFAEPDLSAHPFARAQATAVETAQAKTRLLERSYFPRFNLQTAVFGRGTSALLGGNFDSSKGWYPNTPNWAVGLTITFPVFDISVIRARKRIESSNAAAEEARYEQTMNALKTQESKARALVEAARRVAENTPVQLKAAQETEVRARARYENGLTNVIEVAEAQRLLAQAEVDDAVARLGVWRALLAAARIRGDIKPFLQRVASAPSR